MLLQSSAIVDQCLPRLKAFWFSSAPSINRLEMREKLAGDTARTADPNFPKGYSISYGIMLSNKNWYGSRGCLPRQHLLWHSLGMGLLMGSGEWLSLHHLLFFNLFASLVNLSLSQPTSFITFVLLILSPVPLGVGSERMAVWVFSCWPGSIQYRSLMTKQEEVLYSREKSSQYQTLCNLLYHQFFAHPIWKC